MTNLGAETPHESVMSDRADRQVPFLDAVHWIDQMTDDGHVLFGVAFDAEHGCVFDVKVTLGVDLGVNSLVAARKGEHG